MSRECTTAGMQEVEPCREQLPMDARSDCFRIETGFTEKELAASFADPSYTHLLLKCFEAVLIAVLAHFFGVPDAAVHGDPDAGW